MADEHNQPIQGGKVTQGDSKRIDRVRLWYFVSLSVVVGMVCKVWYLDVDRKNTTFAYVYMAVLGFASLSLFCASKWMLKRRGVPAGLWAVLGWLWVLFAVLWISLPDF
jgi:hypothetical protein